jgi:Phosphopantetheine attachment site
MTSAYKSIRVASKKPKLRQDQDVQQEYIAPRTSIEKALTRIFVEVFGIEKIGIRDNFFSLGLDIEVHSPSMQVAKFAAQIRRVLKVNVPLMPTFYERPSIEQLSEHIEQVRRKAQHRYRKLLARDKSKQQRDRSGAA